MKTTTTEFFYYLINGAHVKAVVQLIVVYSRVEFGVRLFTLVWYLLPLLVG